MQIRLPNRQVEQLLHRRLRVRRLHLRLRRVCRAIGVNDQVDHRMLEHNALQTDPPLHERDDMNVDEGAIDVRIRQLVRRLQSVNRSDRWPRTSAALRFQRNEAISTRPPVASSMVSTTLRRTRSANAGLLHVQPQPNNNRQQAHSGCDLDPQPLVRASRRRRCCRDLFHCLLVFS